MQNFLQVAEFFFLERPKALVPGGDQFIRPLFSTKFARAGAKLL
jgi:hypothetical protein